MTRTITPLLLLLTIIFASCSADKPNSSETVYESDKGGVSVKVWEIKRSTHDSEGFGVGDHMMNGTGSLSYLLKNMSNPADARLDIDDELGKTKKGYRIEVNTADDIDVKTVINQVLADWTTAIDFDVFYGVEDYEVLVMTISDMALLKESAVTNQNGVTSRAETRREAYEIEGSIEVLTGALEKNEDLSLIDITGVQLPAMSKFLFKLDRTNGMEGIKNQLKDKYGISLNTKSKAVKLLKVK